MKILVIALALFVTSAAAAEYSDLYIIPVAGHAQGAHGTSWRSDLVLHNVQTVPISVEVIMVESNSTIPVTLESPFLLMPGETRTLTDVAGDLGRDIIGALIVGADHPFAVTSRTWAELPSGRTLGQSVVPVAIAGAADAVNDVAVLPSLMSNAQQRSNTGVFIAATHAPIVVEIATLSPTGANLGTQLIVAGEPGFLHRQIAMTVPDGTAIVRILEGDGIVVPYASTIDNVTAEALFVPGAPISSGHFGGMAIRSLLSASQSLND